MHSLSAMKTKHGHVLMSSEDAKALASTLFRMAEDVEASNVGCVVEATADKDPDRVLLFTLLT